LKEQKFVSIVAYVRDDEVYIQQFLDTVVGAIAERFENFEVIFVDDGSADASLLRIREGAAKLPEDAMIQVVRMGVFQGLEAAMNAGTELSIGDFVFEFDTVAVDYPAALVGEVYEHAVTGFDVVAAVPPAPKGLIGFYYHIYHATKVGGGYALRRESFRIVSRRAINRVHALARSTPYRKVGYMNSGMAYGHLAYDPASGARRSYDRQAKSGRFGLAMESLILYTTAISYITTILSVIFFAFAVVIGIYVVVLYFGTHKPIEGWTPMMGVLAVGFGGIFLILTILIKYMSMTLHAVTVKQNYVIASIEKIAHD
jgi:dolichol-phosphate mannosyltransferase